MEPRFFKSAAAFRVWLERNHASVQELVLGFYKKEVGRGITYPEALDEALCFGWIDGVRRKHGTDSYTGRFTPRRPDSCWSAVNTARAEALIASGRMAAPGLRAFRKRDSSRKFAAPRQNGQLDPVLEQEFRRNRKAHAFFEAQPPGYRKMMIGWIMSAKKDETRARRFANLLVHSEQGTR